MAALKKANGDDTRPVLDIQGLTVSLPDDADRPFAIEDVTFTVGRGEIVCVVGESGSGKSVTAHTVMGLTPKKQLKPVAGKVLLEGDDLLTKSDPEMRQLRGERMAMIFQEPMTALNPVMKVGDQIAEMLEIHTSMSASERSARVLEVMKDVSLPDAEQMMHFLSTSAVGRTAATDHDCHGIVARAGGC